VTKTRLRNLMLPVGLAVLAVVLIGAYIVSYRNSVTEGAELVKVMVAARDIPAGTDGSAVASGGYLKTENVPRRAVVPGSVVSAAPLTSMVAKDPIYKGQQVTLRQFGPISQGGIFAKFSGKQRAVALVGDPTQLLAGTASAGDYVDVVATTQYTVLGATRSTSRVVLRNLLVLDTPDEGKEIDVSNGKDTHVTLVMSDRQTQTMGWAMKNSAWFLALRPTARPRNSAATLETLRSFLGRALPPQKAAAQITGNFRESVRG
jgi:Flp pilus assembly protein CpaB